MPLFADADVNQGATLVAVLMAALSGLFAWLSAREKRLSDKDRLDSDMEKIQMRADIDACREDRDELRGRVKSLEDLFKPPVRADEHLRATP